MNDPYPIEVDKEMTKWPLLKIGFEEGTLPINFVEPHEALRWREVHQTCLWDKELAFEDENQIMWQHTLFLSVIRAIPSGYQKSWLTSS